MIFYDLLPPLNQLFAAMFAPRSLRRSTSAPGRPELGRPEPRAEPRSPERRSRVKSLLTLEAKPLEAKPAEAGAGRGCQPYRYSGKRWLVEE